MLINRIPSFSSGFLLNETMDFPPESGSVSVKKSESDVRENQVHRASLLLSGQAQPLFISSGFTLS